MANFRYYNISRSIFAYYYMARINYYEYYYSYYYYYTYPYYVNLSLNNIMFSTIYLLLLSF
jgi:hypothetical protein